MPTSGGATSLFIDWIGVGGGGNFYRAAFQGNTLVYVTAQPQ